MITITHPYPGMDHVYSEAELVATIRLYPGGVCMFTVLLTNGDQITGARDSERSAVRSITDYLQEREITK